MASPFNYRPKFVDIRVRKPPTFKAEANVQLCQHPGCSQPATCRAPKSRSDQNDVWHFCQEHAALYNRNWDFFAGMSEAEWQEFQSGEINGHRPTWTFRGNAGRDTSRSRRRTDAAQPAQARVPAHVRQALETLDLAEDSDAATIRRAYAELVRRYHPDSNGGDRSAELRLNAVVKAYKVLKTARRA